MAKYKIIETEFPTGISTSIKNNDTGINCPQCKGNKEYDQFLQDVKEEGLTIVEGPDVVTPDYRSQRLAEYPSIEDQLDKLYHTSLTAWKADIKAVKDKYPKTNSGSTTVGSVPSWVQEEVDKLP